MNWREFKFESTLIKVDYIDSSALGVLFENNLRMGNESNNNVMMATVSPEFWMSDISETILNSVSYVTKFPNFQTISYTNGELFATNYQVLDSATFNTIEELKKFIRDKGQMSLLVVYSIIQYVDLKILKTQWVIRYKEIIDPQTIRDKKIDYLTNGNYNN
jgi:hypothetical protein